jgi:hypothetical protein
MKFIKLTPSRGHSSAPEPQGLKFKNDIAKVDPSLRNFAGTSSEFITQPSDYQHTTIIEGIVLPSQ